MIRPLVRMSIAGLLLFAAGAAPADVLSILALQSDAPSASPTAPRGAAAEATSEAEGSAASPMEFNLSAGFIHEFGANFSGGGSVEVERGFASGKLDHPFDTGNSVNLKVAWGGDWYRFDGTSELSPAPDVEPWSDIQAFAVLGRTTIRLDDRWSTILGLDLRFAGEVDAPTSDSITYGGLAAISYSFSPELTLGFGALVSTQLEDSILVIPALVIYYQVTDQIVISNVLGPEVYPTGAGIEIAYRPDRSQEVAIGSRFESRRFRLDDSGPANRRDGVGEDTGFPLWLRSTWRFDSGLRLDLVGGVSLFNRYELDDRNGNRVGSADLDPAPFIGGFLSWSF